MIKQFKSTHIWNSSKYYTTTPGQSGTGSNGNEGALYITQNSRTEASTLELELLSFFLSLFL